MILRKRSVGTLLGGIALGGLLAGCGDDTGGGATTGELGNGTFDYECINSGDLKCASRGAIDEFELGTDMGSGDSIPTAVAVGATFGISYEGTQRENGQEEAVTLSAVEADDQVAPNRFRVSQPVEAGFLASTADGAVVDFVHVTVLEATSLSVWYQQDDLDSLELEVGESVEVVATPRAEVGTFLAGALPYEWTSGNPDNVGIGEVGSDGEDDEVRNESEITITGLAEGTSTIVLRSGNLSTAMTVEVTP